MTESAPNYSSTCRSEIADFVKCTRERLRNPSAGHARGDVSECLTQAQKYADCVKFNKLQPKGEKPGAEQKMVMPPLCEMETAVYGQCMANLLDNEVRRRRREDGGDVSEVTLDPTKCAYTLSAFEKCLKANPNATSDYGSHGPTYYWMSNIYWQAPAPVKKEG